MDATASTRRVAALRWTLYLALAIVLLTEQWGRTTTDTRMELSTRPGRFLRDALSLWDPSVSLGQIQNQAYGYLVPQGLVAVLADAAHVPLWLAQRGWSVLLLVLACEGARLVAREIGCGAGAATLAGLAYGLTPRLVAEVGVRSAEILPAVVLPWAVLPLLHLLRGRQRAGAAALLSAAAFGLGGGVNGTATAAPAGLLAVLVCWAWATGRVDRRFVAAWAALMVAVNAWWAVALSRLGAVSPPFFDYVEDARTTTSTAGASAGLRGASNWVDYLTVGGARWWPAGYDVSFAPYVVAGSALVAAAGVIGLARTRSWLRTPLLLALGLGFSLVTIAHVGPLTSPLAPGLRDLLDGPLAPLRNVPKADPILRLPLALGLGLLAQEALERVGASVPGRRRAPRLRPVLAGGVVAALVAGLLGAGWPLLAGRSRTPGWTAIPSAWQQASARLDAGTAAGDAGAVWVVPGSGFGIQTWGWTMEEPLQVLGRTPWVTRSQVPLTPAATIRMLSSLEDYLETGTGSPFLATALRRIGIDRVLLRHDLAPAAQSIDPGLVSRALARSPGIRRTATFGRAGLGPAIELFDVGGGEGPGGGFRARPAAEVVTVSPSVEDVVAAVGSGLLDDDRPAQVPGGVGVPSGVRSEVVGDGLRRRERNFGRVHDATSSLMTADDPTRTGRLVPDYPGPPGARLATAAYPGLSGVTATSSTGYADVLGPVRPETGPWAALDGDPSTAWLSAPYLDAVGQGITLRFASPRRLGRVTLAQPLAAIGLQQVRAWRVVAAGVERTATVDPFTGVATLDLGGVEAGSVEVEAADVPDPGAQVGLAEIGGLGVAPRTLDVPAVPTARGASIVLAAAPETRACAPTLLGPDCSATRARPSEEATGIDRTITLDRPTSATLVGAVVARSRAGTLALLDPASGVRIRASSWFGQDPAASPRMLTDDDARTSWLADPRDPAPTLRLDLGRTRTVSGVRLGTPTGGGVLPSAVVVSGGGARRVLDLGSGTLAADGVLGFEPLRARRLTLTLTPPDGTTGDPAARPPVGLSSLRLRGADLVQPLDGGAATGAACGLGPPVVVDGVTRESRVDGRIGAVLGDADLGLRLCGGPLRLAAGAHRIAIRSTEQFQPVAVQLRGGTARTTASSGTVRERTVRVETRDRTTAVLAVGAGPDALLSAPWSINAGWRAVLVTPQGRTPLAPIELDGWAQGWRLPAGEGGRVELTFAPQRRFEIGLVVGLALLAVVLLAAAVTLVRRRPSAPPAPEAGTGSEGDGGPTPRRRALALAGVVVAAGLVSGPVALLAALLGGGLALHRHPRAALVVSAALLAIGAVVLVVDLLRAPTLPSTTADQATACGLWLALALGLLRRGPTAPAAPPAGSAAG
ncbi:alpha-(1-_3)-arabinofuranosyltransferase [Nocardioides sp. TRM66260-LWL]|uniref:alpha-(1->3)-arabinofuranosyltransferase domain-containing protein n=1 Tax=Nocardioides sp. TRM66260-LWL TaxID=2874478 RepID=UPI001CC634C4|nr:alpha-(1->3)-arabinofuranosyltransferase family protein [Nocardioides sp. TRM66260-LWL]MBZ5733691.1 alpha-(1->3)-arabinofuranosyltransferase [Nocardioides sp. TRM66260-LWL]